MGVAEVRPVPAPAEVSIGCVRFQQVWTRPGLCRNTAGRLDRAVQEHSRSPPPSTVLYPLQVMQCPVEKDQVVAAICDKATVAKHCGQAHIVRSHRCSPVAAFLYHRRSLVWITSWSHIPADVQSVQWLLVHHWKVPVWITSSSHIPAGVVGPGGGSCTATPSEFCNRIPADVVSTSRVRLNPFRSSWT